MASLARNHDKFAAPLLAQSDKLPVNFRCKVAKNQLVGGMQAQSGSRKQEARRQRGDFSARKIAKAFESGERLGARPGNAVVVESADAYPVVERLQGQMQVLIGFKFKDDETPGAIEREQIEHAAIASGESRHLRIEHVFTEIGEDIVEMDAEA